VIVNAKDFLADWGMGKSNKGLDMKRSRILLAAAAAATVLLFLAPAGVRAAGSRDEVKRLYDPIVKVYSTKYRVPADLVHSIIKAESDYDCRALSVKGAAGLMQLMPETATQYGVRDRFNPDDNIMGGVKYLKDLCQLFNNNTKFVLAAYNAGQEAIKKFGGIPPYPETKEYIRRVMEDFPKAYIPVAPGIVKFRTPDGRMVLTNDPYYRQNCQLGKN
jgi:soluble lytic murein transglycosylase-like protein